jgi:HlyD family secretion protein
MLRFGVPIIAAALLVFGVVTVLQSRSVRPPTTPTNPPPGAAYARTVAGVGLVEASSENIAISTPVSGLCTQVYVKVGDRVRAGPKLFSLDDRDLQAELAVRRRSLEVAQAQLEKLLRSPRPEEVPVAEARVAEAEQTLADASVQQRLIESVTDRRAVREEDLQRRRIATKSAEARLRQAKADLALLKAGAWREDIQIARAQVALAERQLHRLQTDIDRLTVTAPMDGQVLQSNIRLGEYAQSGPLAKPLMVFGHVSVLNVRTDVDEHEAWKVRADAAAYATVRGSSGTRIPLRFVRFEPYVVPKKSLTGDSTERVDTRVLQVIYEVEGTTVPLYVGQQLDVFIEGPTPS